MTRVKVFLSDAAADLVFDASGMDTDAIQRCVHKTIQKIGVARPCDQGIRMLLTDDVTVDVDPDTHEAQCTIPMGLVKIQFRPGDGNVTVSGVAHDPKYQLLTDRMVKAARECM